MDGLTTPSGAGERQAQRDAQAMGFMIHTLNRRPDLIGLAEALTPKAWPRFMLEDDVAAANWGELTRRFAPFQFVICTEEERVIAAGNTIPLTWDGTLDGLPTGWDAALLRGVADQAANRTPTTLSALAATIDPAYQGRGVSRLIIDAMRDLAAQYSFADLNRARAPVAQEPLPAHPYRALRRMAAGCAERRSLRPVAPDTLAPGRSRPVCGARIDGDHRNGRRVGRLGGDAFPRERALCRARRA